MKKFEIFTAKVNYLNSTQGKNRPVAIIQTRLSKNKVGGLAVYGYKPFWSKIPGLPDLMYQPKDIKLENLKLGSFIDISRTHRLNRKDFDLKTSTGKLTETDIQNMYEKTQRLLSQAKNAPKNDPDRIFDFLTLRDLYVHHKPIPGKATNFIPKFDFSQPTQNHPCISPKEVFTASTTIISTQTDRKRQKQPKSTNKNKGAKLVLSPLAGVILQKPKY